MALTPAQIISVYECLGVTYGPRAGAYEDSAVIHNSFGVSLTLSEMDTLRDALDTYLTDLSADAQTRIALYITEWDNCKLCVGSIDGGSSGDITGVSVKLEDKRDRVRELMIGIVPVIHIAKSIEMRRGKIATAEKSISVGVIR